LYKNIPLLIDNFKLNSSTPLGEGSVGKVLLARGLGGRYVSLKVLSKETNDLDDIKEEIRIHLNLSIQIFRSVPSIIIHWVNLYDYTCWQGA
jgi:serine/threonine protein kinase